MHFLVTMQIHEGKTSTSSINRIIQLVHKFFTFQWRNISFIIKSQKNRFYWLHVRNMSVSIVVVTTAAEGLEVVLM